MPPYRHVQIAWPLVFVSLALLVWPILVFADTGSTGQIGFFLFILAVIAALFGALTVTVDDRSVTVSFGAGLIRRRFAIASIRSATTVRNSWLLGWGIRYFSRGVLYNASGLDAIELEFVDRSPVRIGTDEPARLLATIRARMRPDAQSEPAHAPNRTRFRAVVVIVVVLATVPVAAISWLEMRPPEIAITSSTLAVRDALYRVDIPRESIRSVTLTSTLPSPLWRTNGFALAGRLRGHFRITGMGSGEIFVDRHNPPFVVVRTADRVLIVNDDDPARTRELYDRLRR